MNMDEIKQNTLPTEAIEGQAPKLSRENEEVLTPVRLTLRAASTEEAVFVNKDGTPCGAWLFTFFPDGTYETEFTTEVKLTVHDSMLGMDKHEFFEVERSFLTNSQSIRCVGTEKIPIENASKYADLQEENPEAIWAEYAVSIIDPSQTIVYTETKDEADLLKNAFWAFRIGGVEAVNFIKATYNKSI